MDLQKKIFTTQVAGKPFTLEVSKLAEQANAAVVATYGDTSVLVTAVMGKENLNRDFFPLTVDYEERFYAAGKIMGSRFVRREGRPSEFAILSGRLIDRSIRPFFDKKLRREVQLVITVLQYDDEHDPEFVALNAASAALMISDIPFNGPVAGVAIAKTGDGRIVVNPKNSELNSEDGIVFEGFIAGTENKIDMIELCAKEAQESEVEKAFEEAQKEINALADFQNKLRQEIGRPKAKVEMAEIEVEIIEAAREFLSGKLESAMFVAAKADQHAGIDALRKELAEHLVSLGHTDSSLADKIMEQELDALVHEKALKESRRPDGRGFEEIRPLHAQVSLFKRLHGSGLFIRGGTQALAVTTLAAPGSEQLIETMEMNGKRRFMLHYNFPPFSTGEMGRLGAPGRREIGHGALAEKALRNVIPTQEEFPYTIRVVSEVLASNGSSSMATTCAATLSLMDAGVPIKKPVAGIAMGFMSDGEGNYKILTDIQGPEDHFGDMDCKVAGTSDGITAMQMDVKIHGVTAGVLAEIMAQAKKARAQILDVIKEAIPAPREKVSDFAPVIATINIKPEQIGEVIGSGGKIINAIIAETGVMTIDIEQTGKVFIAGSSQEKVAAAQKTIEGILKEYEIGEIVEGPIMKILDFGAILDLGGGRDGMIHVSELKDGFVEKVEDVVRVGDFVRARVIRVENGKIALSIKALSEEGPRKEVPRERRGGHGGPRGPRKRS